MLRLSYASTGRFISTDSTDYLDPSHLQGLNLYAYGMNNPVMNEDPSGKFVIALLVALIASFVLAVGASVIGQGIQYGWDNINLIQVGIDGLFGMGSVALAATGIGLGVSIGLGLVMGLGQYAIARKLHGEQMTWHGVLLAASIGAIAGAISGYGARHIKSIIGNMADVVGGSSIKALTTAANNYAAGTISQKGFQGAINLFGKSALMAVKSAVPGAIANAFTSSSIKIFITTLLAPFASHYGGKGISYIDEYVF